MQRWYPALCLRTEQQNRRNMWVMLPGFPLELWSKEVFTNIANSLGRFVFLQEASLIEVEKIMARVLVQTDVLEGLPGTLKIQRGEKVILQPLNFWKIPFRCLNC